MRTGLAITLFVCASTQLIAPAQAQNVDIDRITIRYRVPEVEMMGCGVSGEGSFVVTGGDSIRVFHAPSGALLQQMRPHPRPRDVGEMVMPLSAWVDSKMRSPRIREIVFSPVEKGVFASGGEDGVIRVWKVAHDEPLRVLKDHKSWVNKLAFSPDGRLLASGGSRSKRSNSIGEFRIWDLKTGEILKSKHFYNDQVGCIAFVDNQTIAFANNDMVANKDSAIDFFDIETWQRIRSVSFAPGWATSIVFSPDGKKLIISGGQCVPLDRGSCRPTGRIWIADLQDEQPAKLLPEGPCDYFYSKAVADGAKFVSKTEVAGRSGLVNKIEMRDTDDGRVIWSTKVGNADFLRLNVMPDGKQLVYSTNDSIVFLDAETGKQDRIVWVFH